MLTHPDDSKLSRPYSKLLLSVKRVQHAQDELVKPKKANLEINVELALRNQD